MSNSLKFDDIIEVAAKNLSLCSHCRVRRKSTHRGDYCLPSSKSVNNVLEGLLGVLFPGCHGDDVCAFKEGLHLREKLSSIADELHKQITMAFEYGCEMEDCPEDCNCADKAAVVVRNLLSSLPVIQDVLETDIQAAYDGDPAAKSPMEVVMSYPAIYAIATYRIAHVIHKNGVPLIGRIMTEFAHSRTGIDIHPGATIGESFFIDHGTGVVIGETSIIGKNVKIYQGVTLGALSFPKDENGNPLKGIKRHPEVCDNVTIYAEATILGGDTVIGEGSTVGGNVWLTHSVPPNSMVHNAQPAPIISS